MNSINIISNNGVLTELCEAGATGKLNFQNYTKYACPVCYDVYEKPIITRECKHSLCIPCFENLSVRRCPICRKEPVSITKPDDEEIEKLNTILINTNKNPIILTDQQGGSWLADGAKKHNDFYEGRYQFHGLVTPSQIDLSTGVTGYQDFLKFLLNCIRTDQHFDETIRGVRVSTCRRPDINGWETCVFWPKSENRVGDSSGSNFDSEILWRGNTLDEAQRFYSSVTGLLTRFNYDSIEALQGHINQLGLYDHC